MPFGLGGAMMSARSHAAGFKLWIGSGWLAASVEVELSVVLLLLRLDPEARRIWADK